MSQDSGLRALYHSSEIMNIRTLQHNARDFLEKALSEQEKAFLEQDEALLKSEAQKKDLKKQLEESEAQNNELKKKLEQSVAQNKVLAQREMLLKRRNNSIMFEKKKADEKVLLLSEEHKREKNELFKTIIELEKQLDVKHTFVLEIERIRGALLLMKQMHEDGDLKGQKKMNKIQEVLKKKEEDLTMVELIVKEWISNDEIQEAGKELIIKIIDVEDATLNSVKNKLGDEFYKFVTTALVKVNEDENGNVNTNDPFYRYIRPVMWNYKRGMRATVRDVCLDAMEWWKKA